MGDKFYRLIDSIKQILVKYEVKQKTLLAINYVLAKLEKIKTKGFSKKQTVLIVGILIFSLIIVLWPTKSSLSPLTTLVKIEQSIKKGDNAMALRLINVDSVAQDLSNAIMEQIKDKKLTSQLLSYLDDEISIKIINDFNSIINNKGNFIDNIKQPNAVLSKLLNFTISKTGKILSSDVIAKSSNQAKIKLVIIRPEYNKEIDILFAMNLVNDMWKVTNILNAKEVLSQIEAIETIRINKLNNIIKTNLNSSIALKDFQKSNIDIKNNSFVIRISLENLSSEDILSLNGKLHLILGKNLLGSVDIKINETISAKDFYEKAWTVKLSDYKSLKNIAKANSKSITAKLNVEKVVFSKGTVLELLK